MRNKHKPGANRGRERPPPPTYDQKVRRIYPSATCMDEGGFSAEYVVFANNGSGNVLAVSKLSAFDAWKRAAAVVEPPKRATI